MEDFMLVSIILFVVGLALVWVIARWIMQRIGAPAIAQTIIDVAAGLILLLLVLSIFFGQPFAAYRWVR
jgi:hypothetical protein